MEFYYSAAMKRTVPVNTKILHVPAPAFLSQQSRRHVCLSYKCIRRLRPQRELCACPQREGLGRLEGPLPVVIALLFCFASFRICWSRKLSMTRTCRLNRMSKKHMLLNVRTLNCPHLCSFQRTSLNCKL